MPDPRLRSDPGLPDEVVDAVVRASRVLVAVAVRSINSANSDVTVAQHRALVILVSRGPQRIADLAALLDVDPSTATRMAERLERRGLAVRVPDEEDRRVVRLKPTDSARELVTRITRRRRAEVREILNRMRPDGIQPLIEALGDFSGAAGEPPEDGSPVGWVP